MKVNRVIRVMVVAMVFFVVADACTAQGRGRRGRPAADVPQERGDENSRIAHQDLLAKVKQGKIDVYFVGDSITRRWGATDYPELLEHWNETFHGWNAANFAWGGDGTQHILWRLENGEFEGVSPKVIVIQCGTNNLGGRMSDARIAEVTRGILAVVVKCRSLAPEATIILTGLFPRNDNMDLIPAINKINENISAVADGRTVRWMNINDKLADEDGVLKPGMSRDRLHLERPGFEVWAAELKPVLTELLGPPAETDEAPPATGNPAARR